MTLDTAGCVVGVGNIRCYPIAHQADFTGKSRPNLHLLVSAAPYCSPQPHFWVLLPSLVTENLLFEHQLRRKNPLDFQGFEWVDDRKHLVQMRPLRCYRNRSQRLKVPGAAASRSQPHLHRCLMRKTHMRCWGPVAFADEHQAMACEDASPRGPGTKKKTVRFGHQDHAVADAVILRSARERHWPHWYHFRLGLTVHSRFVIEMELAAAGPRTLRLSIVGDPRMPEALARCPMFGWDTLDLSAKFR